VVVGLCRQGISLKNYSPFLQAYVSSGTNFNLQFPKNEDGSIAKDYLDFEREPGKVKVQQSLSFYYSYFLNVF